MTEPTSPTPAQAPVLEAAAGAETSMLTALHAMAHAAGLAMMAGPQNQAAARHLAIARLTRAVIGLAEAASSDPLKEPA